MLNSVTLDRGRGKILILFCNLFTKIFLDNNSILNIPGSKDIVLMFLVFDA